MRLFKYEMRKLLINKPRLILLIVLFTIYILISFFSSYFGEFEITDPEKKTAAVTTFNNLVKENRGELNKEQLEESIAVVEKAIEKYGEGEPFYYRSSREPELRFHNMYVQFGMQVDEYNKNISDIQSTLDKLEASGETESYKYKSLKKRLDFQTSVGEPVFEYAKTWNNFFVAFDGQLIIFLFVIVLTFFISPLFTQEVKTEMDQIVLCSKGGRREVVTAKILSATLTSVILAVTYVGGWLIGTVTGSGSIEGYDVPARSIGVFALSLLDTTALGAAFVCTVWLLVVAAAFGITLAFVSSKMKNQSAAFGIGIVILIAGLASGAFSKLEKILWPVIDFNFGMMSSSTLIWGSDKIYDFFGTPITYGTAALMICIFLMIVFVTLTYMAQRRRSV